MTPGYLLKSLAILALLFFTIYIIRQNPDAAVRKRWEKIGGCIVLVYFIGEFTDEFSLFG